MITFFPAKEEEQGDPTSKHADLRNAIHNDVNGDPKFAKQCHDCFDFAALAIYHAVKVFLDEMSDKSLQVFRIFEEYINELVSHSATGPYSPTVSDIICRLSNRPWHSNDFGVINQET